MYGICNITDSVPAALQFSNVNPAIPFVGSEGLEPPYCKANTTICDQTGFTVQRRYLPNSPLYYTQQIRESNPSPQIFEIFSRGASYPFGFVQQHILESNQVPLDFSPASSVSPQTFILTERVYLQFNSILNVVSTSVCLQHSHMLTSQCVCITF